MGKANRHGKQSAVQKKELGFTPLPSIPCSNIIVIFFKSNTRKRSISVLLQVQKAVPCTIFPKPAYTMLLNKAFFIEVLYVEHLL